MTDNTPDPEDDGVKHLHDLQKRADLARLEGTITGFFTGLEDKFHEINRLNAEHSRRLVAHGWFSAQRARTPEQKAHMAWYRRCYDGIYSGKYARWEDEETDHD